MNRTLTSTLVATDAFAGGLAIYCDCTGRVRGICGDRVGMITADQAGGARLHDALGLQASDADALELRVWLAAIDGADDAEWEFRADEPPARVPSPVGNGVLMLKYRPLMNDGVVTGIVVCIETQPATHAQAAWRLGGTLSRPGADEQDDDGSARTVCIAGVMRARRRPSARSRRPTVT